MLTFQDFEKATEIDNFIFSAIAEHENSEAYKIAKIADLYDKHKNVTIMEYTKVMYTMTGSPVVDFTASNAKITSNFFRRVNKQRVSYLLGNGVFFDDQSTKDALGEDFDKVMYKLGYNAQKHGETFGYWDYKKLHMFKLTEFVPLLDEETSALRAGIRYWRIDDTKPLYIVLYEEDGFTKYVSKTDGKLEEQEPKQAYIKHVASTEADGEIIVGEENYGSLPIIPLWGSELHQSTLVGLRDKIDSYDLVRSGFANDLSDVAMIYWLIENAGGMSQDDIAEFRDRLKIQHIALVKTADGAKVQGYTQDIPHEAREKFLSGVRTEIYEDFGALDVHQVSADSTNDHLEAAYQPLDEEADDFEYQVLEFLQQLLKLIGIEDEHPQFKRNRISNFKEQTDMVLSAGEYLDDETVLKHIPWITVDEIEEILKRKDVENAERFEEAKKQFQDEDETEEENPEENEE